MTAPLAVELAKHTAKPTKTSVIYWRMTNKPWWKRMRVVVIYAKGKVIGCAYFGYGYQWDVGVFVDKRYRRLGLAGFALDLLLRRTKLPAGTVIAHEAELEHVKRMFVAVLHKHKLKSKGLHH